MEFRQLSHFVAVAEELSFTRAAKRVNIVQSGISASVGALERELGVDLLQRTRHGQVELTEAGRALLGEARRALAAIAAGREAAIAANGTLTGVLRIGVIANLPPELRLAAVVKRMHDAHPAVVLRIGETNGLLHDQLKSELIDLAIAPANGPPGITSILLARYPMMFVCSPTHRLADRRSVSVGALRGETVIDTPPEWVTRRMVDRAFADAGIERRTQIEVGQVRTIIGLVEAGVGVTFLPNIIAHTSPAARFVPLDPPIGEWDLTVSFLGPEPASPAARAFLNLLITDFRDRRK